MIKLQIRNTGARTSQSEQLVIPQSAHTANRSKRMAQITLLCSCVLSYLLSIRGNKHIIRLLPTTRKGRDSGGHIDWCCVVASCLNTKMARVTIGCLSMISPYFCICQRSSYLFNGADEKLVCLKRSGCCHSGRRARIHRPRNSPEGRQGSSIQAAFLSLHLQRTQQSVC